MLALALLAAFAGPFAPHARGALEATEIRVGDHAGFVRVVIDFTGGRVLTGEAVATDPDPFDDGVARIPLARRGVQTRAEALRAHGVGVSIGQGSRRIVIHLRAAGEEPGSAASGPWGDRTPAAVARGTIISAGDEGWPTGGATRRRLSRGAGNRPS